MNRYDWSKPPTRIDNAQTGWLVQVYNGDRRLLCMLEPSHAWTFLLGCGLGLLVAVGWSNLVGDGVSTAYGPSTPTPDTPEAWLE